jgi:PKD repeat protein
MGSGGTTTPFGWYVGSGAGAISSTNVTVSNGAVNDAANYNFGANGSSDRALGSLAANSAVRDTEVRFINVSDFDLTALTLSYTGEQWRVGGNGAANNDLVLQYSSDGVNFVALGAAFNFNTPVDSAPPGALDGNAAPNRVTSIGGTYAPASPITSGQVFYLRWVDEDNSSQDHGLAVDDFAISFTLAVPSPEADFTADTTSGVAPLAVQFANLSAHATGYFWDFGDGRTSSLANPSNLYSNTGSFTVTLAAINPIGTNVLTRTNFITVTNHPPVVADFTADLTGGLAPLTVVFTNLSANATDFAWSFGDGNTSTEANPSYTYLNTGSYAVTLTATGPGGTNVLTRADYILVTNIPPLLVMGSDALDFGTVFTGSVAQASLVISNAGGSALSATATLTPAPFFLLDAASNAVGNLSFALPANAETNLVVQFAPGTPGVFTNLSVIFSDGGTATNSLAGRALGTPVIFNLAFHPPEFTFAFATVPGLNYQVQFKDSLEDVFWQALPAIVGDGAIHTITNVVTTPAQRFYRLSIE